MLSQTWILIMVLQTSEILLLILLTKFVQAKRLSKKIRTTSSLVNQTLFHYRVFIYWSLYILINKHPTTKKVWLMRLAKLKEQLYGKSSYLIPTQV